jgi:hypothetical protein
MFIEHREGFETFLMNNRSLLNQVIRKFGTKDSGTKHLREFYEIVLAFLEGGYTPEKIPTEIQGTPNYAYLQPAESAYEGVAPTKFSTQVKSGVVMKELLAKAHRCPICNGIVPRQAISVDHKHRKEDGGPSIAQNAQITHPYCNTGYKEYQNDKAAKAKAKLLKAK